jgi:hypothetical protein
MILAENPWGWTPRGVYLWLRWGWSWGYSEWGIVAHDWQSEERRAKFGPLCWSLGNRPYCQYCSARNVVSRHGSDDCAWRGVAGHLRRVVS